MELGILVLNYVIVVVVVVVMDEHKKLRVSSYTCLFSFLVLFFDFLFFRRPLLD